MPGLVRRVDFQHRAKPVGLNRLIVYHIEVLTLELDALKAMRSDCVKNFFVFCVITRKARYLLFIWQNFTTYLHQLRRVPTF